jgi:hypothetical protein
VNVDEIVKELECGEGFGFATKGGIADNEEADFFRHSPAHLK